MMWMVKRFTSGILDNLRKVGPDKKVAPFAHVFPRVAPNCPTLREMLATSVGTGVQHQTSGCPWMRRETLEPGPAVRCDWLVPNRQYDTLREAKFEFGLAT